MGCIAQSIERLNFLADKVDIVQEIRHAPPRGHIDPIIEYQPFPVDQIPPHAARNILRGIEFVVGSMEEHPSCASYRGFGSDVDDPRSPFVSLVIRPSETITI